MMIGRAQLVNTYLTRSTTIIRLAHPLSHRNGRLYSRSWSHDSGVHGIALFYEPQVQSCLQKLCGVNYETVFRKKKLGQKLREPKLSFMTENQLKESILKSEEKAKQLLQMPPVLPPRKEVERILSFDPYIQGHDPDQSTLILTDITLNGNDRDRLVIARESDGTLRTANWRERSKVNHSYFPVPGRSYKTPTMFRDESILQTVVDRASHTDNTYEFVLDRACLQFEPDDPEYIRVVEFTYRTIDKKGDYDYLSSTRHYGPLVFYLVRTRQMDSLLIHYIKSDQLSPAATLLIALFQLMFPQAKSSQQQKQLLSRSRSKQDESGEREEEENEDDGIAKIRLYIELDAMKKAELELALNYHVEAIERKRELSEGLQRSHGIQNM